MFALPLWVLTGDRPTCASLSRRGIELREKTMYSDGLEVVLHRAQACQSTPVQGRMHQWLYSAFGMSRHIETATETMRLADVNAAEQRVRDSKARYRIVPQP